MCHYLRGTTSELLGILAGDPRVLASVTGPTLSVTKVYAFGGSATVDALDAFAGRSTFVGVEVTETPISRTDNGCVALTLVCQSEVFASVSNVFLILRLTGGWHVEGSKVIVATGGSQGAVGGIVTCCHEQPGVRASGK